MIALLMLCALAQTPQPSATLTGRIVVAGTTQGVDRARVTLRGDRLLSNETTTTADDGTFVFEHVAPGTYHLGASKAGFVTMEVAEPIGVAAAERVDGVVAELTPGAVIGGTVTERFGQPAVSADVALLSKGRTVASRTADDRGQYRFFGLAAGEYTVLVRSYLDANLILQVNGRTMRYAPTAYPGPIAVRAGEERSDADVQMRLVALATIAGTVAAADGASRPNVIVGLRAADAIAGVTPRLVDGSEPVTAGAFEFPGVAPGRYILFATTLPAGATPEGRRLVGLVTLDVDGEDLRDVTVTMQPAPTIAGRVAIEGGKLPARTLVAMSPLPGSIDIGGTAVVQPDGTFSATVAPGRYEIRISGAGLQPAAKGVTIGGRAVDPATLVIETGAAIKDAVITVEPRRN